MISKGCEIIKKRKMDGSVCSFLRYKHLKFWWEKVFSRSFIGSDLEGVSIKSVFHEIMKRKVVEMLRNG